MLPETAANNLPPLPSNTILAPDRNVIFISHATPEDNDFTIWLASRLQADGYEVWIDKQALLGGEKFWQDIDQVIRHRATKVLLVYSENICYQKQRGILKNGVEKEKSMAESIASMNGLKDFIILMNIDGSEYNMFIGADTLNQIPFYENWATGYTQLQKKLKKDGIEPSSSPVGEFSKWYENEYITQNGIKPLREIYYDSWWPIPKLPDKFFIYTLSNAELASQVQQQCPYPSSKATNAVATFYDASAFEITVEDEVRSIPFGSKSEVDVAEATLGTAKAGLISEREVQNHLRSLLQRVFHMIMRERGLRWHDMSNKKLAYFFTSRSAAKIKFIYPRRSSKRIKRKSLFGKHLSDTWHFALSAKPVLTPQLAFCLKSHIVFTTDGHTPWDDKGKMHSARRQKGRLLFNEEWRDLLFAFLHALCSGKPSVTIALSPSFVLSLQPWTNAYQSDFGYNEPKEKDRYNILDADYYEEQEGENDEVDHV